MRNRIELQSFFNYVFRDEDVIHKRIKGNQDSKAQQDKRAQLVEKEVQTFFEELFTKGKSEKADTKQTEAEIKKLEKERKKQGEKIAVFKTRLRTALRALKATHLEEILYQGEEQKTGETLHAFDFKKDEDIISSFRTLDKKYNYFTEAIDDKILQKKFITFYKLCKVIADTLELQQNENYAHALLNAYKMLVLFGSGNEPHNYFKAITQYLKIHNYLSHDMPLHDALMWGIPERVPDEKMDLKGWQALIATSGKKAFQLFSLAKPIEKELGRAPKDIDEALSTAMRVSYPKLAEYKENAEIVEFARLCVGYGVSESNFNKCLDIYTTRLKKTDNLPEANVSHGGYHLVKLPINDLRGFILGHITDCCQSIGGESEQSVIDGITLPNCGFYVILKNKDKTSDSKPFLPDGKIDYEKFDIVGQGYAWRSRSGNLTFDSWENLRPANDPQAVQLLTKFAEHVTQTSADILRVTIGKGGKTPAELKQQRSTISEIMKEGTPCEDARHQSIVARNNVKTQELQSQLKQVLRNEIKEIKENELDLIASPGNILSLKQCEHILPWLKLPVVLANLRKVGGFDESLQRKIRENQGALLANFCLMHEAGVQPDPAIAEALFKNTSHQYSASKAIIRLTQAGLFQHPEIRRNILNEYLIAKADETADAFLALKAHGLSDNEDAITIIAQNYNDPLDMSNFLIELNKTGITVNKELVKMATKFDSSTETRIQTMKALLNLTKSKPDELALLHGSIFRSASADKDLDNPSKKEHKP